MHMPIISLFQKHCPTAVEDRTRYRMACIYIHLLVYARADSLWTCLDSVPFLDLSGQRAVFGLGMIDHIPIPPAEADDTYTALATERRLH